MRFVDSNVFAYHLSADPRYGRRSRAILAAIEKGEETATSTLVITQVCSYLKWKKRETTVPLFLTFLKGLTGLRKTETTILDFEEARSIQRESKVPWRAWDDLVIAAQMRRLGVREIYSNDQDFDGISGVRRIF